MKKFINWNVNGLRAILSKGDLTKLIEDENPDILSLEEIKVQEDQLKHEFDGYYRYINSAERKGYSGTMVLSKEKALAVSYDIEGEDHPKEGRVITLEFEDYFYVCAYVPNSKDGLLRLDYRMHWEDDLRKLIITILMLVSLMKKEKLLLNFQIVVLQILLEIFILKLLSILGGLIDKELEKEAWVGVLIITLYLNAL